jgi:hypothetical protein
MPREDDPSPSSEWPDGSWTSASQRTRRGCPLSAHHANAQACGRPRSPDPPCAGGQSREDAARATGSPPRMRADHPDRLMNRAQHRPSPLGPTSRGAGTRPVIRKSRGGGRVGAALPTPPSSRPLLISRGLGARKREQGDSAFAPIETPDVLREKGAAPSPPLVCGGLETGETPPTCPGPLPHPFQFPLNAD